MKPAVAITGLNVRYGRSSAVENCSLEIFEGEVFGILGPNGAGKSSIMKAITGQVAPYSGGIKIWGEDLTANLSGIKRTIGLVPQDYSFASAFTVEENIYFLSKLYGLTGDNLRKKTEEQLNRFLLKSRSSQRSGDLSGGYKRLLNFALSTIHSPRLLLLDEPTVGLDPDIRSQVWNIILGLKESGNTLVLTTHYLEEATFLCDRLAILYKGRILVTGTPSALIDRHGGETQIFLVLSKNCELLIPDVRKIKGITSCSSNKDILISFCASRDVVRVVSSLSKLLDSEDFEIMDTIVKEPTLDDVFKNVVGAELGVK